MLAAVKPGLWWGAALAVGSALVVRLGLPTRSVLVLVLATAAQGCWRLRLAPESVPVLGGESVMETAQADPPV